MSIVAHPIAGNPRLRIRSLIALLVARQQAVAEQERLAALAAYRDRLPLDHPYRHMLDAVDVACARMVCPPAEPCVCETPGGAG